jgi:type II secretory pathway pseudopilin PulG
MKIKIDNKIWLIIGIAIFIAALVSLVRSYTQQVNEQEELKASLAAQQALLHMLTTEENDQQNKLNAAESLLEASRAKFPESVESIEYGEDFFRIAYGQDLYAMADGCGVELTSLTASKPTDKTGGAVTYSVSSFGVVVNGNIDDILKFIDAIGTGIDYELPWSFQLPWSVDVSSVSIDIGGEEGVATISADIYGYKG